MKRLTAFITLLVLVSLLASTLSCSRQPRLRDWNPDQLGSSDGDVIVFTSDGCMVGSEGNRDIYSVKPDGTELTPLTSHEAADSSPMVSPDGTKIVFRSNRSGESALWIMNRDGSDKRLLLEGTYRRLSWLPDSSGLSCEKNPDIYVIGIDGSAPVNLTSQLEFIGDVEEWSPDGSKLVFSTRPGDRRCYYVINADGSGLTQLNDLSGLPTQCWAPDSSKIMYFIEDRYHHIYVVDANGENGQQLTDSGGGGLPCWSPDSQKILFCVSTFSDDDTYSTGDLWVMNSDGTNKQRLTEHESDMGIDEALWAPDGNKIVYTLQEFPHYYKKASSLIFINSDGTGKSTIVEDVASILSDLEWSYDGQRLLCGDNSCFYTIDIEGGDAVKLDIRADGVGRRFLGWSPDGRSILCTKTLTDGYEDNPEIFLLNTDAITNVTNDTDDIYDDKEPVWCQ